MDQQILVNGYFESTSAFWRDIYQDDDLLSRIYQRRLSEVLGQIAQLALPRNARVLEVGCGAGHLTLALGERGLSVDALDAAPAMVRQTRERVTGAGLAHRVRIGSGDVHDLDFQAGEFSLAVAIGVLPWVREPKQAVAEIARVVEDGGYVLMTMDSARSLPRCIDPSLNPLLSPFKRSAAALATRLGLRQAVARARFASNSSVDRLLAQHGLKKLWSKTVGFGPFTFFNRSIFSERTGIRIDERLQARAADPSSWLRSAGSHYLVLAQKQTHK